MDSHALIVHLMMKTKTPGLVGRVVVVGGGGSNIILEKYYYLFI